MLPCHIFSKLPRLGVFFPSFILCVSSLRWFALNVRHKPAGDGDGEHRLKLVADHWPACRCFMSFLLLWQINEADYLTLFLFQSFIKLHLLIRFYSFRNLKLDFKLVVFCCMWWIVKSQNLLIAFFNWKYKENTKVNILGTPNPKDYWIGFCFFRGFWCQMIFTP